MDKDEKDTIVYRILSGKTRITIGGEIFFIKGANVHQKYLAQELFCSLFEEYSSELMSDDDLMDFLVDNNYWSQEEEDKVKQFKKDIEEFQVKLYELKFKGNEKIATKKLIRHARKRMEELVNKKHRFDNLSARGAALIEKNKFLIGLCLCNERNELFFNEFNYLADSFPLFDRIVIEYNRKSISIAEYREISRTEPWRQYWSAKEGVSSVFDVPAAYLTEEQLSLISWTRLYDSIFQNPKCPPDDIVEDDDALDGFLIREKREMDKEKNKGDAEELISNPKIKGAQEIFMMAETLEDAERINNLNDSAAKSIKRKRDEFIDRKGEVKEAELPDVKRRLQMEINQMKFNKG